MDTLIIIAIVCGVLFIAKCIYRSIKCERVIKMLDKVKKTDPAKRDPDEYDRWFAEHIDEVCKYKDTLLYISQWGYMEETFWKLVKNPAENYRLQRTLIKLGWEGGNLLYNFVSVYDFLPKIKRRIKMFENRYWTVKVYYENYHTT